MSIFQVVSPQERVNFTNNLAILLKSGITINQALADLEDQGGSTRFVQVIKRVRTNVEKGNSLSASFGKEEKFFGEIFINLVKAGEESGTLQGNLQFLAVWLGRSTDLRREVAAATMYPKLVFGAAMLLGGGLAIFILPKLVPLFTGLHVELPLITKILLAISLWVQDYWWLGIFGVLTLIFGIIYLNSFYLIRRFFHSFYLNIPFIGNMLKDYQRALISQLFSTLLKSGLSLNNAIAIVAQSTTNIQYQESLKIIFNELIDGTSLSESMKPFKKLYPNIMISIVKVGEKSGSLVQSFEYLSEFYTKEVNIQTKKLPTIIEPLLLVFIAVIVGFVALAIIMPIYELTGNI